MDDTPVTIQDIFNEVQTNVYEAGLRWFTEQNILDAIQEGYNKLVALLQPIEKSILIPELSTPYYNMGGMVSDFMFLSGLYCINTQLWCEGMSYKLMKACYQTYLAIGEPKFFNVMDLRRVLVWPFPVAASGVLYLLYKASAPTISYSHVPVLPYSIGKQCLEYFATADLLEQGREFKKAQIWWDRLFKPPNTDQRSLYIQAQQEIKNLARADRDMVLEPYRWIFHGGIGALNADDMWISNETPSGTINGTNVTFSLNSAPNPSNSLLLMKNGQVLFEGVGYTLVGSTITFSSGYIPKPAALDDPGDLLRAWYQIT